MNLYEINVEIERLVNSCIDPETGEFTMSPELEQLQKDRGNKLENIALLYKNTLADAAAYKEEKDAFAAREKSAKSKAENLKRYLDTALCGEEFKTTRCDIRYRRSEAVEIDDGTKLPDAYLVIKDPQPNKTEIKRAIKAGIDIAGCRLVERQNIQIK